MRALALDGHIRPVVDNASDLPPARTATHHALININADISAFNKALAGLGDAMSISAIDLQKAVIAMGKQFKGAEELAVMMNAPVNDILNK